MHLVLTFLLLLLPLVASALSGSAGVTFVTEFLDAGLKASGEAAQPEIVLEDGRYSFSAWGNLPFADGEQALWELTPSATVFESGDFAAAIGSTISLLPEFEEDGGETIYEVFTVLTYEGVLPVTAVATYDVRGKAWELTLDSGYEWALTDQVYLGFGGLVGAVVVRDDSDYVWAEASLECGCVFHEVWIAYAGVTLATSDVGEPEGNTRLAGYLGVKREW